MDWRPRSRAGHRGTLVPRGRTHATHTTHAVTLMLVTDTRRACPDARTDAARVACAVRWLDEAIAAGVDCIQVRERDLAAASLRDLTRAVVSAALGSATRVIVNDRADVALVAGADGVHLRDDGWPAGRVRALAGARWLIGRSVHDVMVDPAAMTAVDYVVFGSVFDSGGKAARGCEALRAVVASCPVPVTAIGGITPANAGACAEAGAAGVAAISLFLPEGAAPGALGPREAVRRLRAVAGFPYRVRGSE